MFALPHRSRLLSITTGVVVVSAACASTAPAPERYDILIRGGQIVDGTGNPSFSGDVGIRKGRIAAVGRNLPGTGERKIDATGLVIAPGFIDMHSHSDYLLLEDGNAHSKIRQGVTTDILGEGGSAGPNQGYRAPQGGTGGRAEGRWATLGDYFDEIDASGTSINVASYVGVNNVWQSVMGDAFDRPTEEQFQEMERLVAEAMEDGALGFSTQLITPAGSLTTTDDLVRLTRVVAPYGGIYSSHIRNEGPGGAGPGVFDAVTEAIEIGERAGVGVDVIHLKIAHQEYWGRIPEIIEMIDAARARGVNVQANVYPYTRGNNNLRTIIPPWALEGGTSAMLDRLGDPDERPRLRHDIKSGVDGWYNHYTAVGGDWSRMLISAEHAFKGLTMDRVLAIRTEGRGELGEDELLDEFFDFLIESGGSVSTVYAHHTEEDMNMVLAQPWTSVGSDGSAYAAEGPLRRGNPHPRNFGTFPRVLGLYVRERGLLALEDAVRKMTSLNALKIGLIDRGLLRAGLAADVTVFDPVTVIDRSTYEEPFAYNEGIAYVIVNGVLVLDQGGVHTGAQPGRALRRTSDSFMPAGRGQ